MGTLGTFIDILAIVFSRIITDKPIAIVTTTLILQPGRYGIRYQVETALLALVCTKLTLVLVVTSNAIGVEDKSIFAFAFSFGGGTLEIAADLAATSVVDVALVGSR